MHKDLTKVADLTKEDASSIVAKAFEFKETYDRGIRRQNLLDGKVVAMIFEKPSLRTKVAFEVATTYLGGTPVFLSSEQILSSGHHQQGRESIPDIARNLERFCDLLIARVYRHETIQQLAQVVSKPVVNALCDVHHPSQALADLMAIRWHLPDRSDIHVAYVGDGNNVATSLMQMCALQGIHFSIASPRGFDLPSAEQAIGRQFAALSGASLRFLEHPAEALIDADVVYTDTFVSMGQEEERACRSEAFRGYQVTESMMKHAKSKALFMHCLPAHRGEEVTDGVMDGASSIVFDQAECRLHIAKAILVHLLR